jgi:hypothetical protein
MADIAHVGGPMGFGIEQEHVHISICAHVRFRVLTNETAECNLVSPLTHEQPGTMLQLIPPLFQRRQRGSNLPVCVRSQSVYQVVLARPLDLVSCKKEMQRELNRMRSVTGKECQGAYAVDETRQDLCK